VHTTEIQLPSAGRRRGRYSNNFKRQVVHACLEPGVSTAAVALANGLNANLVRRWVVEKQQCGKAAQSKLSAPLTAVHATPAFIPIQLTHVPPAAQNDIRIELQHGTITVRVHWPLIASGDCAAWVKEVLK
jgi:transposase-like protein